MGGHRNSDNRKCDRMGAGKARGWGYPVLHREGVRKGLLEVVLLELSLKVSFNTCERPGTAVRSVLGMSSEDSGSCLSVADWGRTWAAPRSVGVHKAPSSQHLTLSRHL